MDGGTRAIVYVCVFFLVLHTNILLGSCALTLDSGIFTIQHVSSGQCLLADLQGLQLVKCGDSPEEQWKWGSGHRLFHVVKAQCLGLMLPTMTLGLLDCNSTEELLSWSCNNEAIYVWSGIYLSVTDGIVGARNSSLDRWVRDNSSESICHHPYQGKTPYSPEWYNPGGHHESSVFIGGNEFWFVSEPSLSYEEARLYCASNSSMLATPGLMSEAALFINLRKTIIKLSAVNQGWWVQVEKPGPYVPMSGRCTALWPEYISYREYSCEQSLPFVCEKINITVEKDPLMPPSRGLPCGSDSLPFRDKCYTVLKPLYLSFDRASDLCHSLRGTLPVISSQAEQDFIMSLLPDIPSKFWVGLTHKSVEMQWKWVDGSALTLDNFNTLMHGKAHHLPVATFNALNLCAFMYTDTNPTVMGTWDYSTCEDQQYVAVCQHQAVISDKPELTVLEETLIVKNHTYHILVKNVTWFTAVELCREQGMDLASVSDGFQQAKLTVAASRLGSPLWIGLFSEDQDGVHYRWTDHSHTVFSRWFSEPTSGRCVYLDTDSFWKATECEEELPGAICHVPQGEKTHEGVTVKCPHRAGGPNWIPFRNHCYTFHRASSRWDEFEKGDTRETCKTLDPNAEILTIRDDAENEFVRKQLLPLRDMVSFVWIGIFKDPKTNQLKWYDGTNVQYSNWKNGRPNITEEFMAVLTLSGSWILFTKKHSFEHLKQVSIVACKIDYDSKEEFNKYAMEFEQYGSLNYQLIQNKLTWSDALRECRDKGGHLASAHDLAQDAHLQMISKSDGFPLWIGLSSQDEGGSSFEWSDGTRYDYKPLGFVQHTSKGNCVFVNRTGSWVQTNCASVQEGAICYYNTTQRLSTQTSPLSNDCPKTEGISKWVQYKYHCYAFNMTLFNYSVYTMEEAKTICNNLDASSQLLTIKDEDENTFVSRYIIDNPLITKRVWLNMDLDPQGVPRWADGTSLGFTNWDKNTSRGAGRTCAVMISGDEGLWSQVSCSESRSRIVCKVPTRTRSTPLFPSLSSW